MVLSLATILNFHGGLPDSIKEQTSIVSVYYENFKNYAASVHVIDPKILIPCFINGLNIQIHRKIFGKKFNSLLEVWFSARLCEINFEYEYERQINAQNQELKAKIENLESISILEINQKETETDLEVNYSISKHSKATNPEEESTIASATEIQSPQQQQYIHSSEQESNIQKDLKAKITEIKSQDSEAEVAENPEPKISSSTISSSQFQQQIRNLKPEKSYSAKYQPENLDRQEETSLCRCINGDLESIIEIDVVMKRKVEAAVLLDPRSLSSEIGVEVDVIVTEKAEAHNAPATAMNPHMARTVSFIEGGGSRSSGRGLLQRSSIVARPPTLLAVVFPWDCKSKSSMENNQGQVVATNNRWLTEEGRVIPGELAARKHPVLEARATKTRPKTMGREALVEVNSENIIFFLGLDEEDEEAACIWRKAQRKHPEAEGNVWVRETCETLGLDFHLGLDHLSPKKANRFVWVWDPGGIDSLR